MIGSYMHYEMRNSQNMGLAYVKNTIKYDNSVLHSLKPL